MNIYYYYSYKFYKLYTLTLFTLLKKNETKKKFHPLSQHTHVYAHTYTYKPKQILIVNDNILSLSSKNSIIPLILPQKRYFMYSHYHTITA